MSYAYMNIMVQTANVNLDLSSLSSLVSPFLAAAAAALFPFYCYCHCHYTNSHTHTHTHTSRERERKTDRKGGTEKSKPPYSIRYS